jgi:hypothetical protein
MILATNTGSCQCPIVYSIQRKESHCYVPADTLTFQYRKDTKKAFEWYASTTWGVGTFGASRSNFQIRMLVWCAVADTVSRTGDGFFDLIVVTIRMTRHQVHKVLFNIRVG